MGYSREIYDAAMAELESRRTRAGTEAAARRETLLRRRPRLREIEQEMAHSALRDRKGTRLNSSHTRPSRMPSSA